MNVAAFDGDHGWQIWDEKRWALGPASRAARQLFCRLCVRSLHCPRVHPDNEFCISGRDHRYFVELVWIRVVRTIAVLVASSFNFAVQCFGLRASSFFLRCCLSVSVSVFPLCLFSHTHQKINFLPCLLEMIRVFSWGRRTGRGVAKMGLYSIAGCLVQLHPPGIVYASLMLSC
jgi:hypothetical protein